MWMLEILENWNIIVVAILISQVVCYVSRRVEKQDRGVMASDYEEYKVS